MSSNKELLNSIDDILSELPAEKLNKINDVLYGKGVE